MVSIPKIIQLKNRDEEKVYPVIYSDYCIKDTISEEKLGEDVKEKLNPIVIELQDSGEYSSGRKVYKPKDTDFVNKVAYYYYLYNSGKPINFLVSKVDIEISSTNNYQVPVKEISKPFTAKMPYTLYGRNGNYKIECVVNTSSNFVQAYIDEDSITSNDISNNSITGDKITSGAVTTDKIEDEAITTDKLTDASVTTDKISDGSINEFKIADNAITKEKLADEIGPVYFIVSTSGTDNVIESVKIHGEIQSIDLTARHFTNSSLALIETLYKNYVENGTPMYITDGSYVFLVTSFLVTTTSTIINTALNSVSPAYINVSYLKINNVWNKTIDINYSYDIDGDKGAITIGEDAIYTANIADGAITSEKIADGAITSDKLANSSNYLMKDSVVTIPLDGQLDVIIGFAESPATILSAALENLNKDLPIIFKIQTVTQTNSLIHTNYSSSYYYWSSTNLSTKITTHYLGTYFRAPNNQNALYKVEITWTADTISEPTVTMTNVS